MVITVSLVLDLSLLLLVKGLLLCSPQMLVLAKEREIEKESCTKTPNKNINNINQQNIATKEMSPQIQWGHFVGMVRHVKRPTVPVEEQAKDVMDMVLEKTTITSCL